MNDAGQAVRKSYYDTLNGQVEYDGSPVPIVDEKLDLNITEHDLYMLIGGQGGSVLPVKTIWAKEMDISITVVNRRKATNSKTIIENLCDQILTILFPTRTTNGLTVPNPFKLTYARLVREDYAFDKEQTEWVISKVLIFRNHITQS
jgi:hypothetical protein